MLDFIEHNDAGIRQSFLVNSKFVLSLRYNMFKRYGTKDIITIKLLSKFTVKYLEKYEDILYIISKLI